MFLMSDFEVRKDCRMDCFSIEGHNLLKCLCVLKGSVFEEALLCLPEHLHCVMPPSNLLNIEQYNSVVDLVLEYKDCFVGPDGKVGFTNRVKHKINTGDAMPVKDRGRRKSFEEKNTSVNRWDSSSKMAKYVSPC